MNNPYFNLIQAVWRNGKAWRRSIIAYYVAYALAEACLSLSPYAFGKTIDALQHFQQERLNEVIFWLVFGVVLLLLFWLFHGPARVIERTVALKIQHVFLLDVYKKLTHLPLKWHQEHHSGNVITRLNRSATSLKRFAENQFIYIETIIKFIFSLAFLFWISLPIGILSGLSCLSAALIVFLFDRKLIPLYEYENKVDNHVGAGLFDYISNMTTVLTLRLAQLTKYNLSNRLSVIWPVFKQEAVLNEIKWFTIGMLLTVAQSIILIGYIVYELKTTDAILIGSVVMIFRYQWDLSEVLFDLSTHYSELVRMDTDVKSVQPLLEDITHLTPSPPRAVVSQLWNRISFTDLYFSHLATQRHSAHPMSLTIKRGEKIALIGLSGAGKSTLLNLLSGLYVPDSVRLVIDDLEFSSLDPLHAITTLIPQEPEIFENTIAFNITMDLEVENDVLEKVIELSCFSAVLGKLPSGLATDIREKGFNLSVGQKQRLALARGLFAARFSSLILMDEPTSSVDLVTEKKILSGAIKHYPDASMIVSLHRLHLLPQFDRIIMLDHGNIVADGKTAELLSMDGPVKLLWQKYQGRMH